MKRLVFSAIAVLGVVGTSLAIKATTLGSRVMCQDANGNCTIPMQNVHTNGASPDGVLCTSVTAAGPHTCTTLKTLRTLA